MKRIKLALIFVCIFLPLFIIYYKSQILNLSLVPKKSNNAWKVELYPRAENISNSNVANEMSMALPIPKELPSQTISDLKVTNKGKEISAIDQDFVPFNLTDDLERVRVAIKISSKNFNYLSAGEKYYKNLAEPSFLSVKDIDPGILIKIEALSDTLVFEADTKFEKLKKIFFYIADEIVLLPEDTQIVDVVELSSGSYLAQAKTLSALAKINNIPARIGFGVKILDNGQGRPGKEIKFSRFFYVETFVNGKWLPLLPDERLFGKVSSKHLLLSRDVGPYAEFFEKRDFFNLAVDPINFDPVTSKEQLKHLAKVSPFFSSLSLHRFSLTIQSIFLGIILIPFGTILLSMARVLIGIETFGIFMPILLTLFFLETSFVFGFSFFLLVVLLGFMQRALLDKFHLLAVPRLSILLGIVILLYIGFAFLAENLNILQMSGNTLNYFPIVIITVFIERFSIYYIEEGPKNTLKTTFGTFIVATLCYYLLSYKWLKVFLFNNPEVLLLSIGANLALGSYQGFRLLEFVRFRNFRRDQNA